MFKFRSLADQSYENTKKILTLREIYFAPYEELNDPFEYSYYWTTDEAHEKKVTFWTNQHDYYKEHLTGKPESIQKKFLAEIEKNMKAPRGPRMLGSESFGVFCASSIWENRVLWSLYADSHRGVCFEFIPEEDHWLKQRLEVTYSNRPAEYNLYRGIKHKDALTRKHEDWAYEKEVRTFFNPGPYIFSKSSLVSMIFGVNSWLDSKNTERVNELIEICRDNYPNVNIYRVFKDDATYQFSKEKI